MYGKRGEGTPHGNLEGHQPDSIDFVFQKKERIHWLWVQIIQNPVAFQKKTCYKQIHPSTTFKSNDIQRLPGTSSPCGPAAAMPSWSGSWRSSVPPSPGGLGGGGMSDMKNGWIDTFSDFWFGTFWIFPSIRNDHPNWLIFFRGFETTNQNT